MNSLVLSGIIFVLVLGGIFLGAALRNTLPDHHLSKESQDVVRLGVGLIATIGALVLGLLIAAAKSSFDTQSGQVRQITADVIELDNMLEQYGPETLAIRRAMRNAIPSFVDRLWHEKAVPAGETFHANASARQIYIAIQALSPQNDTQRSLQTRAATVSNDLVQTRVLLFTESGNLIPMPFLAILVFWLIIIFASYSLYSSLNVTVFTFLALFALSASCAIFLILELNSPFTGIMMVPSAPLRDALAPLG